MKNFISLLAVSAIATASYAAPQKKSDEQWITIEASKIEQVKPYLSFAGELRADQIRQVFTSDHGVSIISLNDLQTHELSIANHMLAKPSCPGFVAHESYEEALAAATTRPEDIVPAVQVSYKETSESTAAKINELVDAVESGPVIKMNKALEAMGSRHIRSARGNKVSRLIAEHWKAAIGNRNDVRINADAGKADGQNSIILEIKGTEKPDEIIVVGGHLDSTSSPTRNAPGADDDASGISSITGLIAAIGKTNMKFKRSIHLMGYSAEEVGLKGSAVIAKQYKRARKKVVGVLQLDMTGFQERTPPSIITDHTNKRQNGMVERLNNQFKRKIGLGTFTKSRCGYGCSDHASWTSAGYPSTFTFETDFGRHNKAIHTPRDKRNLISDRKMTNFSKLAAAFVTKVSEDSIVK